MAQVLSSQNPTIKLIRSLAEKKFRQETGLFVAEGWEMLDRARKAGWVPEHLVSTEAISAWGQTRPILVTEKVMEGLSGQNNPHNVIATFGQRYVGEVTPNGVWVALEDMRDPGNLGTIIRTADAVAASGVILVGQSCDPYSGDCVRATTGSIFGVPLVRMETEAFIGLCKTWPGDVVGTHLKATEDFRRRISPPPCWSWAASAGGFRKSLRRRAERWCAFPCPAAPNRSTWPPLRP